MTQELLRQAPDKWEKIGINQGVDPRDATIVPGSTMRFLLMLVSCPENSGQLDLGCWA